LSLGLTEKGTEDPEFSVEVTINEPVFCQTTALSACCPFQSHHNNITFLKQKPKHITHQVYSDTVSPSSKSTIGWNGLPKICKLEEQDLCTINALPWLSDTNNSITAKLICSSFSRTSISPAVHCQISAQTSSHFRLIRQTFPHRDALTFDLQFTAMAYTSWRMVVTTENTKTPSHLAHYKFTAITEYVLIMISTQDITVFENCKKKQ